MKLVNIYEAKTHFSQLVNAALKGEKIVIAKGGKPLVTLTPYEEKLEARKGGQLKGTLVISDDFDAPLPEDVLTQFYGSDDQ